MAKKRQFAPTHSFGGILIAIVIVGFFIALFCIYKSNRTQESLPQYAKTNLATVVWNTYVQGAGQFSIQYPSTWSIQDKHEFSNREIDDPTEINTVVLKGKEGEIVLQWGPMGFGGGCNDEMGKIQLRNGASEVCRGVYEETGKRFWSGISRPGSYNPKNVAFGAHAEANSTNAHDAEVIEKILSTLSN